MNFNWLGTTSIAERLDKASSAESLDAALIDLVKLIHQDSDVFIEVSTLIIDILQRGIYAISIYRFLNMLLESLDTGSLCIQFLLDFVLSNNYMNRIISIKPRLDDDSLSFYIILLKSLSNKLNQDTANLLFDQNSFPLLTCSLPHFDSSEPMIRLAGLLFLT